MIVSFNFNKISAERKAPARGKISIKNNVAIKDIKDIKLQFGKAAQKGLHLSFEFTSVYEPKIGQVILNGDIVYVNEESKIKDIVDKWKKEKKLPADVSEQIFNTILTRCNVQALLLSSTVNMPPQIPLPKVARQGEEVPKPPKK